MCEEHTLRASGSQECVRMRARVRLCVSACAGRQGCVHVSGSDRR